LAGLQDQIKDFLANFEKGQLVGIDIGLSAVKVALMSRPKKNLYRLEHYASIPLSEAAIIEDEIQKPEEIIEALENALAEAKITKKIVCLGLDGPNTMTKRLQVPDGTKEEIEDSVLWESEQYIPFGADESEVDFQVLGDIEGEDVKDVLIVAVKIDIAENYINIIKELKLIPKVVDLKVLAITNLFETAMKDEIDAYNAEGAIIVDFGAQKTTIIVYKNKGPLLTKEISIGGVLITEEIQRQMALSYEEAENIKTQGDDQGNLPEEILGIIEAQTKNLMDEIKKVLNFYIAAGSSEQILNCFVTGGGCRLPGIQEALADVVGCEVKIFNPFDGVEYDKKAFDSDELDKIITTGVVAMGLGMRSV
jgi:type IV pilus assembly protein PilM